MPQPKLFATIEGVPIYHVHKDGFGEGRITNRCYSTTADEETFEDFVFRCEPLGVYPESFWYINGDKDRYDPNWMEPFEAALKSAIAEAIRSGRLLIPDNIQPTEQ